ncbi:DUF6473 family protein [Hoeflea sp. TYP-13]|uniref:DUF6473 family protein n=1 Tax=Hoeflea sp. TYP-13 TaxID=3230023 RepID=UPI0034C66D46
MGHYYQNLDQPNFDYELAEYPEIGPKQFRGPAVDISRPYAVCIGAAQTYGRFAARPYPNILSEELGLPVLNLGVGGAGPEHFDDPAYVSIINRSEFVVIQVLAGRSASNSLFSNREDGGVLGKRLSDNKTMRFEHFFEDLFAGGDIETIEKVVQETRENYTITFANLLAKIQVPKILFWFSDRSPDYEDNFNDPYAVLNRYPQLVNRRVFEDIKVHCDDFVEYANDIGMPQKLFPGDKDIDGAQSRGGYLYNTYYPSPEMHLDSAPAVISACRKYTMPVADSARPKVEAAAGEPSKFVLLCPERSGSNLLLGLLDSHEDCLTAGELFNDYYIEAQQLPIENDDILANDQRLSDLRSQDPVAFVNSYFDVAKAKKLRAIGFKMMYSQADKYSSVTEALLQNPSITIIHLVRRNLLRRFASELRARITDKWAYGAKEVIPEQPTYTIEPDHCVWDFLNKEGMQSKYDGMLDGRDRYLKIYYENLADQTQVVGSRLCRLLGLSAGHELEVRYRKSSPKDLDGEVENYRELRTFFKRWSHFFDG